LIFWFDGMTEGLFGQVQLLHDGVLGEIGSRGTEKTTAHFLVGLGLDELRLTSVLWRDGGSSRSSRPHVMKRGNGWFEKTSGRSGGGRRSERVR
jgi:hypothetical protein